MYTDKRKRGKFSHANFAVYFMIRFGVEAVKQNGCHLNIVLHTVPKIYNTVPKYT